MKGERPQSERGLLTYLTMPSPFGFTHPTGPANSAHIFGFIKTPRWRKSGEALGNTFGAGSSRGGSFE